MSRYWTYTEVPKNAQLSMGTVRRLIQMDGGEISLVSTLCAITMRRAPHPSYEGTSLNLIF
jgi:hypothetical protein